MPALQGATNVVKQVMNWFKNVDEDPHQNISSREGHNFIPRGDNPVGKKLSDRAVSDLATAYDLVGEHGQVRRCQSLEELQSLSNRFESDPDIFGDNLKALHDAINARKKKLPPASSPH